MAKQSLFSDPVLANLYELVVAHLGELPEIQALKPNDYFRDLCESIMSQQLSTKVASTLIKRVKDLVGVPFSPEKVLKISEDEFRKVGLSYAKARYVKAVAEAWKSGLIDPFQIEALADEAVIKLLTQIKGVGRWTAEMFLIFTLGRVDVFSVGDYGLRKALMKAYGLPLETKPAEILKMSEQWKPYRSLASRILWKSLELPKD